MSADRTQAMDQSRGWLVRKSDDRSKAKVWAPADHPITRSPDHRILYVSYPLLTVSEESAGGAEQMLWTLEHEMFRRGMITTVAASAGSRVAGELFVTGNPCKVLDDFERRNLEHQGRILELIGVREREGRPFDLIHDKSGGFWPRAKELNVPVLATLHLPRHFYPVRYFEGVAENVVFNCVSESQAASFADLNPAVVPNGIPLDHFQPCEVQSNRAYRSGLLWLGRICEEKAPHLALEIAARANLPITLAGQVYPFSYHQQYFDREVRPRLHQMPNATFISSLSADEKRWLLRHAKAVLITSLVEETSSLVAMEAAASGAPVIAFRRGALPEIVQDGVTGFLVDGADEAVAALQRSEEIEPANFAAYVRKNFSSATMAEGYARLYSSRIEHLAHRKLLCGRDKGQG